MHSAWLMFMLPRLLLARDLFMRTEDGKHTAEALLGMTPSTLRTHDQTRAHGDLPKMEEADMRLLCCIFGGFSPQVVSLFLHDSVADVYARKSRLKSCIKASEAEDKELFMSLLE